MLLTVGFFTAGHTQTEQLSGKWEKEISACNRKEKKSFFFACVHFHFPKIPFFHLLVSLVRWLRVIFPFIPNNYYYLRSFRIPNILIYIFRWRSKMSSNKMEKMLWENLWGFLFHIFMGNGEKIATAAKTKKNEKNCWSATTWADFRGMNALWDYREHLRTQFFTGLASRMQVSYSVTHTTLVGRKRQQK